MECRPGFLLGNPPCKLAGGRPLAPGLPRYYRAQLPLGVGSNLGVVSLAPGGQVGYVAVSWPVVQLVHKDIEAPPELNVVTDLRHSVSEPDLEQLLVALDVL